MPGLLSRRKKNPSLQSRVFNISTENVEDFRRRDAIIMGVMNDDSI